MIIMTKNSLFFINVTPFLVDNKSNIKPNLNEENKQNNNIMDNDNRTNVNTDQNTLPNRKRDK